MTPSKEELAWLKRNGWRKSKPCNYYLGCEWPTWKKRLRGINDEYGFPKLVGIVYIPNCHLSGDGSWGVGICSRNGRMPGFTCAATPGQCVTYIYETYIRREISRMAKAKYNVRIAEEEFLEWRLQNAEANS